MGVSMKSDLGDGVYANFDGYSLKLSTENGYEETNAIFLEPEVLAELFRYVAKIRGEQSLEDATP